MSVLIVTPPKKWQGDLGLPTVATLTAAEKFLETNPFRGVVLFSESHQSEHVENFLKTLVAKEVPYRLVLVSKSPHDSATWKWLLQMTPFRVVDSEEADILRRAIEDLIERVQLDAQEEQRQALVQEKTEQLKHLNRDLETRVERRQKSLQKAKGKLLNANRQIETLHAATLSIHRARSVAELEALLVAALKPHFQIEQARIRYSAQSSMTSMQGGALHQPLLVGGISVGDLLLFPNRQASLSEEDQELLHQIADAVALGVDRLAKLEQAEVLKQQWQATFDAIAEPLCLTDRSFRILRTNRTFAHTAGKDYRDLLNTNCFEALFDSTTADELSGQGPAFKTRRSRGPTAQPQTFEISVQPLNFESFDGEVYMVLLRDISHRLHLERQLVEASKMAELGLIGSSIAHELNNPLGGMLSFIQLIRMELKGNESYAADIHEMERAAGRCRDIIQDLLGFARRGDTADRQSIDLREVIAQALKISELQTRSQGIVVTTDLPKAPLMMEAQPNQLSQALCNILQNSAEAILEKRRDDPRARGEISVALQSKGDLYELLIGDTGVGISPDVQDKIFNPLFTTKASNANSGLGLTMAFKIIAEHAGRLELSSQPGVGTTAKIAFHRPDESPEIASF